MLVSGWRALLFFFAFFISPLYAEEDGFLTDFFIGNYLLIGKGVDSSDTYFGKVEIRASGHSLTMTRLIGNTKVTGIAVMASALGGEAKVLRMRFSEKGTPFEETCLWQSDLDNYARVTCYLYRPGVQTKNPGLEALFHDRSLP